MRNRRVSLLLAPALVAGAMATSQADARTVQYGALVFDRVALKVGLSNNQSNATRAVRAAKAYCRQRGGRHCFKVTVFKNACGSMFLRPKDLKIGWGVAFNLSDAKRRARQQCGSSSCREAGWSCTTRWR